MLFAVATTNTGFVFSCSQVRKVPKTRAVVPESPVPVVFEKPFSISSTQSTHGATASAVAMAVRRFCSLEPTRPWNTRPMSRRSSGRPQEAAMALAVSDFPQPGTPVISTPRGAGRPNRSASERQAPCAGPATA